MKYLISTMLLLSLTSCGGGDDGTIDNSNLQVTPTTEDLKGTYALNNINDSLNSSGNLYIDEHFYVWEVVVKDTKLILAGQYDVNYTNSTTEGIITVINSNSVHNINFTASSNQLLTEGSKVIDGSVFYTQESWTKTNDRPFSTVVGDPPTDLACTASIEAGLCVYFFDSQTGDPISCGTNLIIKNAVYHETVSNPFPDICYDNSGLCGLYERPGIYNLEITKNGYYDKTVENIIVTSDYCHVNRLFIDVNLEKTP